MRSPAEERHEDSLWHGVSRPTPVLAVIHADEPFQMREALEDSARRHDDAFWWWFVHGPFTWQRFTEWWVARRWVMPRDVKKQ